MIGGTVLAALLLLAYLSGITIGVETVVVCTDVGEKRLPDVPVCPPRR